jgi:hypothetical protein
MKHRSSVISEQEYVRQAVDAWERAWDMVHSKDGWKQEAGHENSKGCVHAKHFPGRGKVFKLEAVVDAPPEEVFEVLVPGVNEWPVWNPTILDCKMVQVLNENTDIAYSVGAEAVGGLVSSRDFVNLRHWKCRDGAMMSSACAVTHPDMPPTRKHVRAENKPACYLFKPVPGHPNKCQFTCLLSTELKGWMPQFLVDQALSGVLMDYLKHLKLYLDDRRQKGLTVGLKTLGSRDAGLTEKSCSQECESALDVNCVNNEVLVQS